MNTQSIRECYLPYFDMNMTYTTGRNNLETGKHRRVMTLSIIARFNITNAIIISWLYQISRAQALAHLNKLVDEGLTTLVKTHRSPDGRVYVLTYSGAKFAEEQLGHAVYFRSKSNPALQFNANAVVHDLICQYCALLGHHYRRTWHHFITEREFKRLVGNNTRHVDGIVQIDDGSIAAIEVEHSFKNLTTRRAILDKWLAGLNDGYYDKIFVFSQSEKIFNDIKRLHDHLFNVAHNRSNKSDGYFTEESAARLNRAIIFRTKFCEEINALFYP